MNFFSYSLPGMLMLCISLVFLGNSELHASHIMAGDLTYRSLGANQYEVTLKLYRDCGGIALGNTALVKLSSSCSADSSLTLNLLPGSGQELPLLCPAEQANSSCNGGSLVGVREFEYVDTVNLSGACVDWTFSWNSCCRNAAITNLQSPNSRGVLIQASLNNVPGPNSSPVYSAIPTPYICLNEPYNYSQGTAESDGDSLVFSLADPLEGTAVPIPFQIGFSKAQPFSPSLVFDPLTGGFLVTPDINQVTVLAVQIKEYRNGVLVGTTQRDLQVIVVNCNNIFPQLDPDSVRNLGALATQVGPRAVELCPGNLLSFDLQATDANLGDSVFISSNAATVIPAGTFINTPGLDTATASFSWTPGPTDIGTYLLELVVRDNHCPLLGVQRYAVLITVLDRTTAGPDLNYCPSGGGVKMQARGGQNFTWTYLGGGIPPASELSCTNCPNPLATPLVTTTYVVSSDLVNCLDRDTITVNLVSDISINPTLSPQRLCLGDTAFLSVTASPGTSFQYTWTPAAGIVYPDSFQTQVVPTQTTWYKVRVEASTGCTVTDSVELEGVSLNLNTAVSQDKVCLLDSTDLLAQVASNRPYLLTWHDPLGAIITSSDTQRIRPLISGMYWAQATDTAGLCFVTDSLRIDVLDKDVSPGFVSICPGDSVDLLANYIGPVGLDIPTTCGLGPDSCCGPRSFHLLGDSCVFTNLSNPGGPFRECTTSTTTYSPYQNQVSAARIQYLYLSSELNAIGFAGGTITELAFFLSPYFNQGDSGISELVIKMGCTNEDTLDGFLEGLATVWGPRSYVPVSGTNSHILDRPYDWDGSGNLVIQICSQDGSSGFASYSAIYDLTSLNTVWSAQSSLSIPPCELTHMDSSSMRPMIQFGVCVEGIDPRYAWSPGTGLNDSTIANPRASPASNTTYTVTITPADNCLCELVDSAQVEVGGCILGWTIQDFRALAEEEGVNLSWDIEQAPDDLTISIERENHEGIHRWLVQDRPGQSLDRQAAIGLNRYRMEVMDSRGGQAFSAYQEVVWEGNIEGIKIIPHPINRNESIQLQAHSIEGHIQLRWMDLRGQLLLEQKIAGGPGQKLWQILPPSGSPGTYILEVFDGRQQERLKVVIWK